MRSLPILTLCTSAFMLYCPQGTLAQSTAKLEKVQIGMSYDEVKKLLGPPVKINRGFTRIEDNQVVEAGQLLYVTWQYARIVQDTVFNLLQRWKSVVSLNPEHVYLVNGMEVTPDEFNSLQVDNSGKLTFHTSLGGDHEIDEIIWQNYAHTFLHEKALVGLVNSKQRIVKRDSITYSKTAERIRVDAPPDRIPVRLDTYIWSVLFDAASGRVVKSELLPIAARMLSIPDEYKQHL